MKKVLSFFVLLISVSSISFATKADTPSASMIVVRNGSTFKLLYKGVAKTNVKVLILNDKDQLIFVDKINNVDGFVRPYNFSELPEGNYSIELTDNNGRQVERVSYRIENENKLAHLMNVPGSANKFILSIPNKGNDIITVTIYNDENTVLYSEKEKITGDFARVYNLKESRGKITFEVTDSRGNTKSLSKESL